jgi:hypothetical protein
MQKEIELVMENCTTINDFESYHSSKLIPLQSKPTIKELLVTALVTLIMAPFSFITFMVIPMMGMITVGFSAMVTALYLYYRRSVLVALTAIVCFVVFWSVLFATIQEIKNNLEVLLFFFTATGIPVSAMYCMYIGSRIWAIRGGAE